MSHGAWVDCKDRLPAIGTASWCRLRHWNTGNTREYRLIRVDEGDCNWRTANDLCEISYDWTVIKWFDQPASLVAEAAVADLLKQARRDCGYWSDDEVPSHVAVRLVELALQPYGNVATLQAGVKKVLPVLHEITVSGAAVDSSLPIKERLAVGIRTLPDKSAEDLIQGLRTLLSWAEDQRRRSQSEDAPEAGQ